MRFEYPARFEDCDGEMIVSFPDIPEALTSGESFEEAYAEATDALGAALAGYLAQGISLPAPSPVAAGLVSVSPPPLVAAKLALKSRLKELDLTNVALAERRAGSTWSAVDHRGCGPSVGCGVTLYPLPAVGSFM